MRRKNGRRCEPMTEPVIITTIVCITILVLTIIGRWPKK